MPLPALRNLDVTPVEVEGESLVCLRDPEGFVDEQIVLSPMAFLVATFLDGANDVLDIQYAFASRMEGALLRSEDVSKVVEYLDEHGFLLTERFFAIRDRVQQEFRQRTTRAAHMAGNSYPADPAELRATLDLHFASQGDAREVLPSDGVDGPARCLIVPHIDFQRGSSAYVRGYRELARHGAPDLVLIFGVAHAAAPVPFILTRKGFETPSGLLQTDTEAVEGLAAVCRWDPFEYEIVHRTEHSIEFQAVMLAHVFGPSVRIVPVLCSALMPDGTLSDPSGIEAVQTFLSACRDVVAAPGRRTTVVAGADLAHVGKRFGDAFDVTPGILGRVDERDREDLAYVTRGDAEAFYRSVMKDGNARRVCGLGCIYSALKTIQGSFWRAELLHYDQAPDPAGGIVSFASVIFD